LCRGQSRVRGRYGQRFELDVRFVSKRRHLPLVALKRAA